MEDSFSNVTFNSSINEDCQLGLGYIVGLSLVDILPVLVGQPVVALLLWITFMSKKTVDILNFNLALFHIVQYLMSLLHLFSLFLLPQIQRKVQTYLFVYVQVGGPMSLSFICMERYVAVLHPTSYPLLKKYRFREICAVTVWLISVPCAFASIFDHGVDLSLREKVFEILPLVVMLVMSSLIWRSSVRIVRELRKSGPGKDNLHPVKKRALKTICATTAITLFLYTPVNWLHRTKSLNEYTYNCVAKPICIFLLSAAGVVHPLVYLSTQWKTLTFLKRKKEAG